MPTKRIVCLANSDKNSGYCFAGKELLANGQVGEWIRPVSARDSEEVSPKEQRYADGTLPQLLDIVDIPLLEPRPNHHQQENWLLDAERRWVKAGRLDWGGLKGTRGFIDPRYRKLWWNGPSTQGGLRDRAQATYAYRETHSLRLIHMPAMKLVVSGGRVQGRFVYYDREYWLRVTDPVYKKEYSQRLDGAYNLKESLVTVSLAEIYHGYCYKLIAGIMEKP